MTEQNPTTGEILRRLDDQAKATERVVAQLETLSGKLEERYLPRGEYVEARKADDRRMGELEKDNEATAAFKRQVLGAILAGVFLMLAQVVVTLVVLRGGS